MRKHPQQPNWWLPAAVNVLAVAVNVAAALRNGVNARGLSFIVLNLVSVVVAALCIRNALRERKAR